MKRNLYILYAIAFLQGMVFYGPIATLYRQAQGLTVFQITLIESISLALGILLEVPWGIVADKIGYRKTFVFCTGLFFVSKVIFWTATGFTDFLVERLMLSVVLAGLSGVDASFIYLSCKDGDSQKAFGVYNSLSMLGLLIATGIFSVFVRTHYFWAGFLTVVSYGIAAILSFGLTEVRHGRARGAPTEPFNVTLRKTLGNRSLLYFLIAVGCLSEAHQLITTFLNQVQYERCGMQPSSIGFVYIIAIVLGLLGVYSSAVTKRIGVCGSLFFFCVLSACSCLTLALTRSAVPSIVSILMLRISDTLFQPLQAEVQNREIQTDNRATALSINSMFVNCVAIGINLVLGAVSDRNLSSAFLFASYSCVGSLFVFLIWHKRGMKQRRA